MEVIFSSFWTFLGTAILIGIILDGIADIIRALKGENPCDPE